MKIVFDSQIFYSQRYGGISRYFSELSAGLARRKDFNVSVIAPFHANEHLRDSEKPLFKGPYFDGQFGSACRFRRWGRKLLFPIQNALNKYADIVHETYYSIDPINSGKFSVVTVYDMIHELFPEQFSDNDLTSKAKKAAISRADHVICISESTRQDLIRLLGISPSKISIIYLGHSLNKRQQANLTIEKPYLLYVGQRGGYKNFQLFCRAFANSSIIKKCFDIVAFGGGAFNYSEQTMLNELGLIAQAHHVVGGDDLLKAYYQGAALFVYPSLYEGFGIPPLEAMSFDCPIACSNTSSIPEVVGEAGIYFDPYSVDSMTYALEHALQSSDFCAQLISKGRERIKLFSWERCVNETADVYKSVAGKC